MADARRITKNAVLKARGAEPIVDEAEGWDGILAASTIERPEAPSTGRGCTLPEGKLYQIVTPNPEYKGQTETVVFENGKAIIKDREKAWRLMTDYPYKVEVLEA